MVTGLSSTSGCVQVGGAVIDEREGGEGREAALAVCSAWGCLP